MFKQHRGELSGMNLTKLNLSTINFKDVRCFRKFGEQFTSANFSHSIINEDSFLSIDVLGDVSSIGHNGIVSSVAYTDDGQFVTSGGYDSKVKVWSTKTRKCIKTIDTGRLAIGFADYLPKEKVIISGGWKVAISFMKSKQSNPMEHLPSKPTCVVIGKDKNKAIFGFEQGRVIEFNLSSREIQLEYNGHYRYSQILCASFTADESSILSCASNGTILKHDLGKYKGEIIREAKENEDILSASICSERNMAIVLFNNTKTYTQRLVEINLNTGVEVFVYKVECSNQSKVRYSNYGDRFILNNGWEIMEFVCGKEEAHNIYNIGAGTGSMAYSSDDKNIVVGCNDGKIIECSTQNNKLLNHFGGDGMRHKKCNVTISHNGDNFLSYLGGKYVYEWSVSGRMFLNAYKLNSDYISCKMAYSPDGNSILVAGGNTNRIEEFDTTTGNKIYEYFDESLHIWAIGFSNNGKSILVSSPRNIMEWLRGTQMRHNTNLRGKLLGVNHILMNPVKNAVILTSGSEVVQKDMNGNIIQEFEYSFQTNLNKIKKVHLNDDNTELMALFEENTVVSWSMDSGRIISENKAHYKEDILDIRGNKRILFNNENNYIEYWLDGDNDPRHTYNFIPGIYINGCIFQNLHSDSEISETAVQVLRMYGAMFGLIGRR